MSFPNLPIRSDFVIGTDDPAFAMTWDRANVAIHQAMLVEHDADGKHTSFSGDTYGFCTVAPGTYTGDGAAAQTIAVAGLRLLFLQLWDSVEAFPVAVTSVMPAGTVKPMTTTAFSSAYVTAMTTGAFTVTGNANVNGRVYCYVAYGVTTTLTGNGMTFEPDWIQHDTSIDVDDQGIGRITLATRQILERFRREHHDNGSHIGNPFANSPRIVVGSYLGDRTASRTINLAMSSLATLYLWANTAAALVLATAGMNGYRAVNQTAMRTDHCVQLAAESFTITPESPSMVTFYNDATVKLTDYAHYFSVPSTTILGDFLISFDLGCPNSYEYWNSSGTLVTKSTIHMAGMVFSFGNPPNSSKTFSIESVAASGGYSLAVRVNGIIALIGNTRFDNVYDFVPIKLQRIGAVWSLFIKGILQGSFSDSTVFDVSQTLYINGSGTANTYGVGDTAATDVSSSYMGQTYFGNAAYRNIVAQKADVEHQNHPFNALNTTYYYVAFGE